MTDARRPPGRFVALGDSFTEGVGDPHRRLPNGVRGWADRVAERLARAEPGWEYANLAIRSKRLRHVVAQQLGPAIELRPTLVTLFAGGNDILDAGTDVVALLEQYERAVASLTATGATVVLFTSYDIPVSPALTLLFRGRNDAYNTGVRRVALQHNALLVDHWAMDAYRDPRMWAPDRMHMSKAGHRYLAARVLDALEVRHSLHGKQWEPFVRPGPAVRWRDHRHWLRDWVLPLVGRKLRGVTLGDSLDPRWPLPVVVPPKGGLRRLVKQDAAHPGPEEFR